jgi:hypothetical protein
MYLWHELGIARTQDERAIKHAYAIKLKLIRPEDDPAAFQRLREAYEAALSYAHSARDHAPHFASTQLAWNTTWNRDATHADAQHVEEIREAAEDKSRNAAGELPEMSQARDCVDRRPEIGSELEAGLSEGEDFGSYDARPSEPGSASGSADADPDLRNDISPWLRKFDNEEYARERVDAFMREAAGQSAWEVAALLSAALNDPELTNLALREEFDVHLMRAVHRNRELGQQFILGVAQALKWEGDERPAVYAEPQVVADVLARIRAARQYHKLQMRSAESAAVRIILGDYTPRQFVWRALDKRLVLRMRNAHLELSEVMSELAQSFVDPRILDWWQRKAGRVNFYWHHLLWAGVLWMLMEASEFQHAFPWNLRGADAFPNAGGGPLLWAIALPLGCGGALCYEWALLRWERAWATGVGRQPLFMFGWPLAMLLLAGLAALDSSSALPLRWILAPLNGAVLLWAMRALDFKPRPEEGTHIAVACAVFGLWAWCTIAFSDIVLAMLTGMNMFLLLGRGRTVTASAVEHYGGKRASAIWTYAWFLPLAALVSLTLLRPAYLHHNAAWLFACYFLSIWGMLATPFHVQRCAGCLIYGFMGAFIVAAWLAPTGDDQRLSMVCSLAFALLLGAYFLVELLRRVRAVK